MDLKPTRGKGEQTKKIIPFLLDDSVPCRCSFTSLLWTLNQPMKQKCFGDLYGQNEISLIRYQNVYCPQNFLQDTIG